MTTTPADGFGSKHEHWHPGEDRAFLDIALNRVHATRRLPPYLTYRNTGYLAEWWHQQLGDRPRYYTRKHIAEVEERMKKVPAASASVIDVQEPQMKIVRTCPTCGGGFEVLPGYKTGACPSCRAKSQHKAKKGA